MSIKLQLSRDHVPHITVTLNAGVGRYVTKQVYKVFSKIASSAANEARNYYTPETSAPICMMIFKSRHVHFVSEVKFICPH